jgi:hypothetical protein
MKHKTNKAYHSYSGTVCELRDHLMNNDVLTTDIMAKKTDRAYREFLRIADHIEQQNREIVDTVKNILS